MNNPMHEFELVFAGRWVTDVWDRIRRYCGLAWSGGGPETWAYRYYDAVDTDAAHVTPVDVLSAGALHPGLSLSYFWDHARELDAWLAPLSADLTLRDADESVLDHLGALAGWRNAPALTLLSKVLHRKRPALIPLVDRHVLDWYRPVTGHRTAQAAWPALLSSLREDLGGHNALLLSMLNVQLEKGLGRRLTHLRLVDIAIWMGARP